METLIENDLKQLGIEAEKIVWKTQVPFLALHIVFKNQADLNLYKLIGQFHELDYLIFEVI